MVDIFSTYAAQGLHLPTETAPDGIQNEKLGKLVLYWLFYLSTPACPQDPDEDHPVLMAWLDSLNTKARVVKRLLDSLENDQGSADEGVAQLCQALDL
jgi:hypothetical protein